MDVKDLKNLDKEQLLEMLGLEESDSTITSVARALGLIGIGAVVGAALMLFLAPQSGREMRSTVTKRVRNTTDQAASAVKNKIDEAQSVRG